MSALTDLFTAMANKIRSKTGTATTYTPLQMVSDGIDDVYAAGYDAGGGGATGIPITPSNASPVSLTTGDSYEMLADGYAISSYTNVTPSDSSPAAMTSGTIYKAGSAGYAIASNPSSITPSSSGTYFASGIKKMTASGYAYSSQPTPTETTLWTNSSPTSTFAAQTVNLSQAYSNFDYLKFVFRRSTSDSYEAVFVFPKSEFTSKSRSLTVGISGTTAGSDNVMRNIYQSSGSTSQMKFSTGWAYGNTNVPGNCIPKSIVGIKN